MLVQSLHKRGLIHPPKWLPDNTHYLTEMGSIAYGVSTPDSDVDLYGFCIPPKDNIFPHLRGEIPGFGTQTNRFEQWQEVHIIDPTAHSNRGEEYDFAIYSIVKYFQLCMDCNPNMIDSLFTPVDCVRHVTRIGQMVLDNRTLFLSKKAWYKFRGYAHSNLSKMVGKTEASKRYEMVQAFGYDLKFAYHVVRLMCEIEQILTVGTIDLRRDAELLKTIRRGEWTEQQVRDWFVEKERVLEPLYNNSNAVPYTPDESSIKTLLLNCLEEHYGSLQYVVITESRERKALRQIAEIVRYI